MLVVIYMKTLPWDNIKHAEIFEKCLKIMVLIRNLVSWSTHGDLPVAGQVVEEEEVYWE